jgi:hypothetical protein
MFLVFVHALLFLFFPLAIFQARIFAKFFFFRAFFYFFTGSSWEKVFLGRGVKVWVFFSVFFFFIYYRCHFFLPEKLTERRGGPQPNILLIFLTSYIFYFDFLFFIFIFFIFSTFQHPRFSTLFELRNSIEIRDSTTDYRLRITDYRLPIETD